MPPNIFDESSYKWVNVSDDSDTFKIHHDYTILGHDLGKGTCDMLVRWHGDGGHCMLFRTFGGELRISGEHHLIDLYEGGREETRVKRAGDYSLSLGDAVPHRERGGPEGAVVFFGNHTTNGVLYELVDADLKVIHEVTIEEMVEVQNQQ